MKIIDIIFYHKKEKTAPEIGAACMITIPFLRIQLV